MKKYIFILVVLFASTFAFVSCEPNNPEQEPVFEVTTKSLTLYVGDIKTLQVTSELAYTVKSEDEFVATTTELKNVKGEHVGKTTITITNGKKTEVCEIEVLAKYKPFTEPYIPNYGENNGISFSEMWRKNVENLNLEIIENTDEYTIFAGKEENVYFLYFYDTALNITEMQMRFYDVNKYEQPVYQYLAERFKYWGYENGITKYCYGLTPSSSTLVVTEGTYSDGTNTFIAVVFTPKKKG